MGRATNNHANEYGRVIFLPFEPVISQIFHMLMWLHWRSRPSTTPRKLLNHWHFLRDFATLAKSPNGFRAAVVGSGPGGMACADELAKLGLEVVACVLLQESNTVRHNPEAVAEVALQLAYEGRRHRLKEV